jgi:alkyldihydroxyacetonephosphate synthase
MHFTSPWTAGAPYPQSAFGINEFDHVRDRVVRGRMRPTSHWGWGFADRFPDRDTRAGFGAMAEGLLGFAAAEPEEPVSLDAVRLAPSRIEPPADLAAIVTTEPDARVRRSFGKSYPDVVRGMRGLFAPAPDAVARPRDEREVEAVLAWCDRARFAVIPFGGGTSVTGGVEADVGTGFSGVVTLDLGALSRVLEVDDVSLAARVQAGVRGPDLNEQLGRHGVTLRHFPQSYEHSTLGGWIATRAGGHYATLYTHIDDFVQSLRLVAPAGRWETRRLPASGAGPSPDRLLIGSEGSLGVITEAWLRVQKKPTFRASASARFDDFGRACEAMRAIVQAGLHPANCRLLDAREAALNSLDSGGRALLLLGFESADHELRAPIERAGALAREAGGEVSEPKLREGSDEAASAWRAAFFEGPYLRDTLVSLGVLVDTFETAVTWDRLHALRDGVTGELGEALRRVCGAGVVTCRITHCYPDGAAPYFTFLAPARRGAELEQWRELKTVASDAVLRLGGTITHHHAVGRMHRPWYERERPALFGAALAAAKRAFDPNGIMNPGVLA